MFLAKPAMAVGQRIKEVFKRVELAGEVARYVGYEHFSWANADCNHLPYL